MNKTKSFFRVSAEDFKKIPGSPIAYWISKNCIATFANKNISYYGSTSKGIITGNNSLFLRTWSEVSVCNINFTATNYIDAEISNQKWYPCNKGGEYRKWYGNNEYIINWKNNGHEILQKGQEKIRNCQDYSDQNKFVPSITWTSISSGKPSFRYSCNALSESAGMTLFISLNFIDLTLGMLSSIVSGYLLNTLNPTLNFTAGSISSLPLIFSDSQIESTDSLIKSCIESTKSDWDSYETSWDFQTNPLLTVGNRLNVSGNQYDLSAIYIALRRDWQRQTEEIRRLEIENNRIFIDAYGLQDELSPEVPWNEITLTCNPWYRYGKKIENFDVVCNDFVLAKKERIEILPVNNNELNERAAESFPFAKETEERLLEDTVKELISYAVGCMMGRYSPEKPGLILANQGDDVDRYKEILIDKNTRIGQAITENTPYSESATILTAPFYPIHECCEQRIHEIADKDGVIPILDEEWFIDDIVAQFKSFLKFTFGMEHFAANLDFIEKALGKDIRKYFIKDFYKDHVQRYKKRPIYWMFSSPKGSFNALIYMHRYRPDTVSIVLNEYLREFISKIRSHREHLITENNRATLAPAEKTRNLKLIDKYAAMLTELDAYERDILYPLAQQKIAIDLDDGVKVNYCKFGAALKKIPGLEAKEE